MTTNSFLTIVHIDRFHEISLVVGDHAVTIDPIAMGTDSMVEVLVTGDSEITRKLYTSFRRIKHILMSAPSLECS